MAADAVGRETSAEDPEPGAEPRAGSGGPSVAAHPRATRQVARARGWAGLVGFALGGYLSQPSATLATAGLRALIAGVVCYLAVWAGAVFVWRQVVMIEYAGARDRLRGHRAAAAAAAQASAVAAAAQAAQASAAAAAAAKARQEAATARRRANVRIQAECSVVAYVGDNRSRVQTYTLDLSAGGMLVAGLSMLEKGERFEFQLTLAAGAPPVEGAGSVVRSDPQGRCAVVFDSLREGDERRLSAFITDWQRGQRQAVRAA